MNKMDPDEEEEDEDGNPIKRDKVNPEGTPGKSNSNSHKNAQVSFNYYRVIQYAIIPPYIDYGFPFVQLKRICYFL